MCDDIVVLRMGAAMFFRVKKSGQRAYLQIVENHRIGGTVRQSVIANLGRAEALIASGALAALLASGGKLTDQVLLDRLPSRGRSRASLVPRIRSKAAAPRHSPKSARSPAAAPTSR